MRFREIRVMGVPGLPEVVPGDDLGELIVQAVRNASVEVYDRDIFVVAQKVVSKAEGRLTRLDTLRPSPLARHWAETHGKDARQVEAVMNQARRMVRMERGVLIAETKHGFVCANAGVDASNVPPGVVTLLPQDPDLSAAHIRATLEKKFGVKLGVIVADTFGRPWRQGLVNVALGVSGLSPFLDYRGQLDGFGRRLKATLVAVADELASAAELIMGKTDGVPVALVRGFRYQEAEGYGQEIIRPPEEDLFK